MHESAVQAESCTDPVLPSCDICFAGRFVRLVLFLFCSLISISNIEKYLRVISNYDSDDLYTNSFRFFSFSFLLFCLSLCISFRLVVILLLNAVAQTWKRVG